MGRKVRLHLTGNIFAFHFKWVHISARIQKLWFTHWMSNALHTYVHFRILIFDLENELKDNNRNSYVKWIVMSKCLVELCVCWWWKLLCSCIVGLCEHKMMAQIFYMMCRLLYSLNTIKTKWIRGKMRIAWTRR